MLITARDRRGIVTQLYQDTSPKTTLCDGYYSVSGTSVCGDVIELPINSKQLVQTVNISTASYLTLCEVEIFAGMHYINSYVY